MIGDTTSTLIPAVADFIAAKKPEKVTQHRSSKEQDEANSEFIEEWLKDEI